MGFLIPVLIGLIVGGGYIYVLRNSTRKPPIRIEGGFLYRVPRFMTVSMVLSYALFATFAIWSAIDGAYGSTAVFVFFGVVAFIPFMYYSGHSLRTRGEELMVVNGKNRTIFSLSDITGFKGSSILGGIRVYLADGRNVLLRYEYRGAPYLYNWLAENLPGEQQSQLAEIIGDKFLKNEKA